MIAAGQCVKLQKSRGAQPAEVVNMPTALSFVLCQAVRDKVLVVAKSDDTYCSGEYCLTASQHTQRD